jgi:ATP phosphoribosyltransferase
MLRIALPNKGRLSDEARELFADAGLDAGVRGDRALTASLGEDMQALFLRAQDIPEFIADGAADVGVTGWDLVRESGRELASALDLGFGACRLVVAVKDDLPVRSLADLTPGTRVATPFPRIAREFLAGRGLEAEVVPLSGAAEVAPHLKIADVVLDLTSTGSTLRVNGLREIETVMESSARLVARPEAAAALAQGRCKPLADLVLALDSVRCARGKRYVMANVPRAALEDVKRVLPGLNGPTVVDILNGGAMVAVHAVVEMQALYRTIGELQSLGARGLLVTRIERLVP